MQLSHQASNQMVVPGAPPTQSHLPNVGLSNSSSSGQMDQAVYESYSQQSHGMANGNKQFQEEKKNPSNCLNNSSLSHQHQQRHSQHPLFNAQQYYQPPDHQQQQQQHSYPAQYRNHFSQQQYHHHALQQQQAAQQAYQRIQLVRMVGCLLNQMIKNCQHNMQRKQMEQKGNLNDSQVTTSSGSVSWQRDEDDEEGGEQEHGGGVENEQQNHFIPFQSNIIPQISIIDYLIRIAKYSQCSECCFIMALIYIDRLTLKRPNFYLTAHNIHSAKFYDDIFYDNKYYARIGGITSPQINQLEILFLHQIGFDITISPQIYENYRINLIAHFANMFQQQQQQNLIQQQMMLQQQTNSYYQSYQQAYEQQQQQSKDEGEDDDTKQQLKEPQEIIKNASLHKNFQKHPSSQSKMQFNEKQGP